MAVFIFTAVSIEILLANSVDPDQTPHLNWVPKCVSGLNRAKAIKMKMVEFANHIGTNEVELGPVFKASLA